MCHPERSEGSEYTSITISSGCYQILRFTQNDTDEKQMIKKGKTNK